MWDSPTNDCGAPHTEKCLWEVPTQKEDVENSTSLARPGVRWGSVDAQEPPWTSGARASMEYVATELHII